MREISTTVTVGEGSEIHNHDLEYRSTLKHVHERAEGVIEVIPYLDYQTQINLLAKPFIDEYNEGVEKRYQAAWDRYNAGETKTKPRKRDYPKMGYDYYTDHLHDTYFNRQSGQQEELPMFRSMIVGLGDQSDREEGRITEEEAVKVMTKVVRHFREDFPYFHILGATIHLDEKGFYHCHIDYKPMYAHENSRGLNVNVGQESALEAMGLEPEQSIINGRDKVPLRFNAFRNKIYHRVEQELAEVGIRLQYGVSAIKDPGKDSSKNQKLEDWQTTQDAIRDMQHSKNVALDIMSKDEVSPDDLKKANEYLLRIEDISQTIGGLKRKRLRKDKVEVDYSLIDQLQVFLKPLIWIFAILRGKVDELMGKVEDAERRIEDKDRLIARLEKEKKELGEKVESLENVKSKLENRVTELTRPKPLDGRIQVAQQERDRRQKSGWER